MHPTVDRTVALVRAVAAAARRLDVGFLAAAVAYYAFVSLVPLTLLGFAIGSAVGGNAMADAVEGVVGGLLAPEGVGLLETALSGQDGRGEATLVGTVVLAWSGLRVFRGLDRAFSRVYAAPAAKPLPEQLRDALLVLGAVLAGIAGTTLAGAAMALLPVVPSLRGLGVVGLWLTLMVAFLPLYVIYPDSDVSPREALPGAALAAGAFAALGVLFGVYTDVAGGYQLYGVLGAILLVATWLYFGALAVMVGAVLNAVRAGRLDPETA